MPYIIKNGLTYTGNLIPITQAKYDDLSEAEKNNGIAYFIVDSDAVLDASDVGLGEGNVEDLAGSVAVIETSPATATHAVGSYIVWNGQLYSVIDAIQVGQALTVGSNITATSAGSEISALKSGLSDTNSVISNLKTNLFIAYDTVNAMNYNDMPFGLVYNTGVGQNCPTTSGFMLVLTMALPNGAKAQLAMDFYNATSSIYFRNQTASTWRAWKLLSNA